MTKQRMGMRVVVALLAFAILGLYPVAARASSYLDSAALLLDEARKSSDWINSHFGDLELATVAHELSEARVKAGRTLSVSKAVERAHPHLLLTLETCERAMAAAVEHESTRFLRLVAQARDEERTFRAILSQQRLSLPELEKR